MDNAGPEDTVKVTCGLGGHRLIRKARVGGQERDQRRQEPPPETLWETLWAGATSDEPCDLEPQLWEQLTPEVGLPPNPQVSSLLCPTSPRVLASTFLFLR